MHTVHALGTVPKTFRTNSIDDVGRTSIIKKALHCKTPQENHSALRNVTG